MYWPAREPGDAPAAPQLRLMLSRSCCCSACMRISVWAPLQTTGWHHA